MILHLALGALSITIFISFAQVAQTWYSLTLQNRGLKYHLHDFAHEKNFISRTSSGDPKTVISEGDKTVDLISTHVNTKGDLTEFEDYYIKNCKASDILLRV